MRIRKPLWVFTAIVVVTFFIAWYTGRYSIVPGSRIIFYRIGILALLIIAVNWVWTYFATRKISIERFQRSLKLPVGNVFEERFEIKNESRVGRLWIEIEDHSDLPGNSGSKVLSQFTPNAEKFYISRTELSKRGAYHLGPTTLRSGDPFGMFFFEKTIPYEETLIVLPYIETLDSVQQMPGLHIGGRAIRRKSLQATANAAGVREYQPGDPLNRVHWRSSAKRDHFMVKEFDQDPQGDIWILLDACQDIHYEASEPVGDSAADSFWAWKDQKGFRLPPSTFEYSVSLCASLSNYFTRSDKPVGFACADSQMLVLPPEKGERQFGKIMDTLAFLEGNGSIAFDGLVETISQQIPRGSAVFLVTTSSGTATQVAIEILMRKRLNPFLIMVDKSSFSGKYSDMVSNNDRAHTPCPQINIRYNDSFAEQLRNIGI